MSQVPLPAPRRPGTYRVGLVCLGNIGRSPMADVVLSARVAEAGLDDVVTVASSGTGGWHVGKPMDPRAAATLSAAGYDPSRHRAQQFAPPWHETFDLLLPMDAQNLADIETGARDSGGAPRVRLFRYLDPDLSDAEVPDPYYGGDSGFEEVLSMVEHSSDLLVDQLRTIVGR